MAYCEKCGAPLTDTARFCGKCGTPTHLSAPASVPGPDVAPRPALVPAPPAQSPYTPTPPPFYQQQPMAVDLGSVKTFVLVAYIVSILAAVGTGITGLANLSFGYLEGVIWIAWAGIAVFVILRIGKMRLALNRNDAVSAHSLNTVGFAVLAIIFGGVLSGILLLVAREDLGRAAGAP